MEDITLSLDTSPKALMNYLLIWQIGNQFSFHTKRRPNPCKVSDCLGKSRNTLSKMSRFQRSFKLSDGEITRLNNLFGLKPNHLSIENAELIVQNPERAKWWDKYAKFLSEHNETINSYPNADDENYKNLKVYKYPLNYAFTYDHEECEHSADDTSEFEKIAIELKSFVESVYQKYSEDGLTKESVLYKICYAFDNNGVPYDTTSMLEDVVKGLENVSFDDWVKDNKFENHFKVVKEQYNRMLAIHNYQVYKNKV